MNKLVLSSFAVLICTIGIIPAFAQPVQNVTIDDITDSSFDVTWDKHEKHKKYKVLVIEPGKYNDRQINVVKGLSTTITDLEPDTKYKVVVFPVGLKNHKHIEFMHTLPSPTSTFIEKDTLPTAKSTDIIQIQDLTFPMYNNVDLILSENNFDGNFPLNDELVIPVNIANSADTTTSYTISNISDNTFDVEVHYVEALPVIEVRTSNYQVFSESNNLTFDVNVSSVKDDDVTTNDATITLTNNPLPITPEITISGLSTSYTVNPVSIIINHDSTYSDSSVIVLAEGIDPDTLNYSIVNESHPEILDIIYTDSCSDANPIYCKLFTILRHMSDTPLDGGIYTFDIRVYGYVTNDGITQLVSKHIPVTITIAPISPPPLAVEFNDKTFAVEDTIPFNEFDITITGQDSSTKIDYSLPTSSDFHTYGYLEFNSECHIDPPDCNRVILVWDDGANLLTGDETTSFEMTVTVTRGSETVTDTALITITSPN